MKDALIENWFSYHDTTPEKVSAYVEIRDSAKQYAKTINRLLPDCADKTAAMRQLRLTTMAANCALACYPDPS